MFSRLFFLNLQYCINQNYRKLIGQVFFWIAEIFNHIATLRRRTLNETLIFFCQMKFPINLVIAPNVVRFIANTTLPRHFFYQSFQNIFILFFKCVSCQNKTDRKSTFFGMNKNSFRNLINFSLNLFKQKIVLSHYDVKHTKH